MLTTVLPSGRRTGGELVTHGIVDALRAGGADVSVVGYARPDGAEPGEGEVVAGRRPIETASAKGRAAAWMVRALATRAPYSVTKYRSGGYVDAARREIAGEGGAAPADVVVADHAQVAFAVHALGVRPVFVAHNVEADGYDSLAASASGLRARLHRREARLIRAEELRLAQVARQVWTLTEEDASAFRALAPEADVQALAVPSQLEAPEPGAEPTGDIAVIGNWTWPANALGLGWLVREVLPLLPGDVRVEVAGAGADHLAGRDPRLTVRGVVRDAAEFLANARVVAVPAVTGSGVQVKTLDAIACGAPVVATATAVRGLDGLPAGVTVAADAPAFAAALTGSASPAERGDLRVGAIAWSRARREYFDAQVGRLVAAIT